MLTITESQNGVWTSTNTISTENKKVRATPALMDYLYAFASNSYRLRVMDWWQHSSDSQFSIPNKDFVDTWKWTGKE